MGPYRSVVVWCCVAVLSALAVPAPVSAQTTLSGTVVASAPGRLLVNTDNGQMPVVVTAKTRVRVYATGDADFQKIIAPGHTVRIQGRFVPPAGLDQAELSLHFKPQQTTSQVIWIYSTEAQLISFDAVVLNLQPFTVRAIDGVNFVRGEGPQRTTVHRVRPGQIWQANVVPGIGVDLILGGDLSVARPNDEVTVHFARSQVGAPPDQIDVKRPGLIQLSDLQPPKPTTTKVKAKSKGKADEAKEVPAGQTPEQ